MKQFLNSLVGYFLPLLGILLIAFAVLNAVTAMNGTQFST